MEGLHTKYTVNRVDGRDVSDQEFFVLRIDPSCNDEHAFTALRAYASACMDENPRLAKDLLVKCFGRGL